MKGFEKQLQNGYDQLSQETKYRFAEIELSKAYPVLLNLYQFEHNSFYKVQSLLYNILFHEDQQNRELEEEFDKLLHSQYFRSPRKDEVINYLRYKNVSYQTIRNLTKASFNTISKMRFGDPIHYPVFSSWNNEMLMRWNRAKASINVFNEQTISAKPWTQED